MTAPRNFPERVNQRRKDALSRMEHGLLRDSTYRGVSIREPKRFIEGRHADYKHRDRDIAALTAKIINDARGIRTKKNRGARRV